MNNRAPLLLCLFFGLTLCVSSAHGTDAPIEVTFLPPSSLEGNLFWTRYTEIMRAAAKNLGIKLSIVESRHRFEVLENVKKLVASPNNPHTLAYIYHPQVTPEVLSLAEKAGIDSLICNTDVFPTEHVEVGLPREQYKHWLGQIHLDDYTAGRTLADHLMASARKKNLDDVYGVLHLIAVSAEKDATSAAFREQGVREAIIDDGQSVLERVVMANWDREKAKYKTSHLLELYPKANVYWAVHDGSALGVLDAAREAGLTPGEELITGGVDWSPDSFEAIRSGDMDATYGGHFLEGAWLMVMIYDYYHGHDFAEDTTHVHTGGQLITRANVDKYHSVLAPENWARIDFRQFTRTHNPGLVHYDFTPDAMLRAISALPAAP